VLPPVLAERAGYEPAWSASGLPEREREERERIRIDDIFREKSHGAKRSESLTPG
jgi:hypothetical protein